MRRRDQFDDLYRDTSSPLVRLADVPRGGGVTNHTAMALVTTGCAKATHTDSTTYTIAPPETIGVCVLFAWDDDEGEWTADPEGETVSFVNAYKEVDIPEGAVIRLSAPYKIVPGAGVPEGKEPPIGRFAEEDDYLKAYDTYSGSTPQVLYHDGDGKIGWAGAECEE